MKIELAPAQMEEALEAINCLIDNFGTLCESLNKAVLAINELEDRLHKGVEVR